MSHIVTTTDGKLLAGRRKDSRDKLIPMGEKAAEARCKEANGRAEKLGISTRYEVRPF